LVGFAQGLWSYGGFKLTGSGYPKSSVPPSGETTRHTPKVLEVQERAGGPLSPCQTWWGSDFTCRRDGQKGWVFCLSVCLCVSHASVFWSPPRNPPGGASVAAA